MIYHGVDGHPITSHFLTQGYKGFSPQAMGLTLVAPDVQPFTSRSGDLAIVQLDAFVCTGSKHSMAFDVETIETKKFLTWSQLPRLPSQTANSGSPLWQYGRFSFGRWTFPVGHGNAFDSDIAGSHPNICDI